MVNPLGFWAFIFANIGLVVAGSVLTGLSFLAYRRNRGQRSYALATLGFGCVVLGGLIESVYTLWFDPGFVLTGREFLFLQAGEDVVVAFGLVLLFYAITQHDTDSSVEPDYEALGEQNDVWISGLPHDD